MRDLISERESLAIFNPIRNIRKGQAILKDVNDDYESNTRSIFRELDRFIGGAYIFLGASEIGTYALAAGAVAYALSS